MINQPESRFSSISIVMPALNEGKCIQRSLKALLNLESVGLEREIIVVDNGSSDNTVELCKAYGVRVVIKKGGTIGSLRNFGAGLASGDLLAFLDADCVVPKDWIAKALNYLENENKTILGFRLSLPEDPNWVAQCWDLLFAKRDVTTEVDWLPTGNMVMSREVFSTVNGFDERLESNEDYDFCYRIKQEGCKIISSSDTAVVHLRPPQSLTQIFKKELWHGKEVFAVFIRDLAMNKGTAMFQRKNFKVIFYAASYLGFLLLIVAGAFFSLRTKNVLPFFGAVLLPLCSSFLVALTYLKSARNGRTISGMTLLLMTYGFSRAIGLLPYDKVIKFFAKSQ